MLKIACSLAGIVILSTVAVAQSPSRIWPDPALRPFQGKDTLALLEVKRVELLESKKSEVEGIAIKKYRATVVVNNAVPKVTRKEITLLVERPEAEGPLAEEVLMMRYQMSFYPFWFPLTKGTRFVAAFNDGAANALDLVRPYSEDRPATDIWSDCERFNTCLERAKSKRLTLDAAYANVIADTENPPGAQFFWLVDRYDPRVSGGKAYCLALAGYLANRKLPLVRRINLANDASLCTLWTFGQPRPPECQKLLIDAHLRLMKEVKETKGGMIYMPNLLIQLYRAYLLEPPDLPVRPVHPYPANPANWKPPSRKLVQPIPALDPETRSLILESLQNGELAKNGEPSVKDALESWLKR